MNTVCPGFVPHHVKPNRCRRCFKDIHDHDTEVSTSFTLPLPRRRRESVAITETPKAEEAASNETSASYTITETTSLGRRTRQRSSSTSSWFQEKKVNEDQKEKIDSLFRNADDSKASYRSTEIEQVADTVAVVSVPGVVIRRRPVRDPDRTNSSVSSSQQDSTSLLSRLAPKTRSDDVSKPPELPPKTLDSRFDFLKKTDSKTSQKEVETKVTDIKPRWTRYGTERVESSFKPTEKKFEVVKNTETTNDIKDSNNTPSDNKFSRYGKDKTEESPKSYLKSKFEPDLPKDDKQLSNKTELTSRSYLKSKFEPDLPKDDKQSSNKTELTSRSYLKSKFEPDLPKDDKQSSNKTELTSRSYLKSRFETEVPKDDKQSSIKTEPSSRSYLKSKFEPELSKDEKQVSNKTELSSKSYLKSKFETKTSDKSSDSTTEDKKSTGTKFGDLKLKDVKVGDVKLNDTKSKLEGEKIEDTKSTTTLKFGDAKPKDSKFGEVKLKDTKFGEVKLRDSSKLSEIRSRATKFESTSASDISKIKETPTTKSVDLKPAKTVEPKPEVKPVLARFAYLKKEEPKPAPAVVKSDKPPPLPPPPPESSSEEESESEEESDAPQTKPVPAKEPDAPQTKPFPAKELDAHKTKPVPAKEPDTLQNTTVAAKEPEKVTNLNLKSKEVELNPKEKPKSELQKTEDKVTQAIGTRKWESKVSELESAVEDLKRQLKRSEEACARLERDRSELMRKQQELLDRDKEALEKTAGELTKMRSKLAEMQAAQEENRRLRQELRDAKAELSKKEAELGKKEAAPNRLLVDQLKQKLAQSEALCEELTEENEEIKKEVRDLEQELEELHDNFREDQASEFRGLKKELETATKNCRVLQFKLRKAEKKCELLELDRHGLEDKVREYQSAVRQDVDRSKFKELEKELSLARNLTASLNREMDEMKEALIRSETENESLRQQSGAPRSVTPIPQTLLPLTFKDGLQGKDYETLSHELFDTMEREGDLREQLKFSEEEAKSSRRKMSSLEQENETLMMQIKKLTNIVKSRSTNKRKDEDAEEEELSAENLKIQLDLMEQEMGVLRRKLDDIEKENENLQSEVKYLQEKVINQPLIELPELPKDAASPGVYWEHKVRQQDYEIRETRRRMIEKDREIERLNSEVEIYRKKASKMMVRSRSLDSDIQVDLKRQLQLVEQEANILRQKVNGLEGENDKLGTENKRMSLRLSKKPPPSSADLLHMDNMELKQKLDEQQHRLEAMKEEIEKLRGDDPVAIIQDYKPRKESLTSLMSENENDLISSLKKKLKTRDEEQQTLQAKAMQLEIENSRLNREYKKLKENLSMKKRPPKAIRDSATRIELREVVSELQDEISELQVNLRSREVIQEGLEEEIEKIRKELKDTGKELKQKEEKLYLEMEVGKNEKEALRKEMEIQRTRAASAEDQLNQVSKLSGSSLDQAKKISVLTQEKREAERRAKAAEEALESKTQKLRDTQEKLNATAALKEDMVRTTRILESQKADLEKELEEQKNLLTKAETRVTDLRNQVDRTDRDLTSLRKECNQLRNELEDERTRLKQSADKRQSEVNVNWSREREGLRRTENELRNRIEHLQYQITENEKIWIEKESRMRDDFKKKKDSGVREAREKGEAALELSKEEEKILRTKIQELTDKIEKLEASLKEATEKSRHLTTQHRRDKEEWQTEKDDLESQIRMERKKREKLERESEQNLKSKEEELLLSRERLVAMEREQRRMQMQVEDVDNLEQKVKILEKEGDKVREEYDLMTSKYEQLEDDFVKTKANLVQDKEMADTNLMCLRRDYNELNFELTSLKGTYNSRQDNWIKEKLDLQERLKELTKRLERLKTVEQERRRLQDVVEEKETLVESYKKEEKHLKEERERMRKRIEELTKLSEASPKAWAAAAARSASDSGDRSRREDALEAARRDFEGRMSLASAEISSMQAQIAALASERDDLRSQLSSAERSAEEVRTGSLKRERARHREEADAARRKVQELRFQLEDVREQLEDAHLENRNLRLQIETDKNTFDIQVAELKSKINHLEEQKILESSRGQTRSIAKTRLELAWEKERTELQHLLSESQKLSSDLKERVQKIETEKEKEKQAVRKQMLEMRSSTEKDHQESRRKMTELHSSLLEIRESHAKLRGMYDRMKKEREILLKEREEWRQRLQTAMQLHTKINELVQDFDNITTEVCSSSEKLEFKETVQKVKDSFAELQKSAAVLKDDERLKRTTSFRRAISAQEVNRPVDPLNRWQNPQRVTNYPLAPPSMIIRPPPRQKSLNRKSLSLDHTLVGSSHEQRLKIWESEGESVCSTPAGSLLSLGGYGYETDSSLPDSEYRYGGISQDRRRYRVQTPSGMTTDSEAAMSSREGSVDPGGSAESVPVAVHQQKKSLKEKLKSLRRTKSIDVHSGRTPSAEGSTTSKSEKVEKERSLRSKITRMLTKPLGRSSSVDSKKPAPALLPKGLLPDAVPSRPTAEKPLSASRSDLNNKKPTSQSKRPSEQSSTVKSTGSNKGRETPV